MLEIAATLWVAQQIVGVLVFLCVFAIAMALAYEDARRRKRR